MPPYSAKRSLKITFLDDMFARGGGGWTRPLSASIISFKNKNFLEYLKLKFFIKLTLRLIHVWSEHNNDKEKKLPTVHILGSYILVFFIDFIWRYICNYFSLTRCFMPLKTFFRSYWGLKIFDKKTKSIYPLFTLYNRESFKIYLK